MAITSKYYTGAVDNVDWATGTSRLGYRYVAHGTSDFKVEPNGLAVRGLVVRAGDVTGGGITDHNDADMFLELPFNAANRWYLVGIRRTWGATNASELDVITGTATKQIPSRPTSPGTEDFHPLALAFVEGGGGSVSTIADLRCISVNSGVMVANDDLVRSYMSGVGTQIRIGTVLWTRVLDGLGLAKWDSFDSEPQIITGDDATSTVATGWSTAAASRAVRNAKHRKVTLVWHRTGAGLTSGADTGHIPDQLLGKVHDQDRPAVETPLVLRVKNNAGNTYGGVGHIATTGSVYADWWAPGVQLGPAGVGTPTDTVIADGDWYVA